MTLVKMEVMVPPASAALVAGASRVVADVVKALANGWQPWDDTREIVQSVMTHLAPVAGSVSKVTGELVQYPAETARLVGLVLGDLVGLALKKVRG